MSDPLSYKQFLKFKSPSTASSPSGGLVLTSDFIAEQNRLKQEMMEFANTLSCPICKSQLDGEVNGKKASLYCCVNPKEYNAEYSEIKHLKYCSFQFIYEEIAYLIVCSNPNYSIFNIDVFKIDLTLSIPYQNTSRKKLFSYIGPVPELQFPILEKDLLDILKLSCVLS